MFALNYALTSLVSNLNTTICSVPIEYRVIIGVITIVLGVSAVAYVESRCAYSNRCHD